MRNLLRSQRDFNLSECNGLKKKSDVSKASLDLLGIPAVSREKLKALNLPNINQPIDNSSSIEKYQVDLEKKILRPLPSNLKGLSPHLRKRYEEYCNLRAIYRKPGNMEVDERSIGPNISRRVDSAFIPVSSGVEKETSFETDHQNKRLADDVCEIIKTPRRIAKENYESRVLINTLADKIAPCKELEGTLISCNNTNRDELSDMVQDTIDSSESNPKKDLPEFLRSGGEDEIASLLTLGVDINKVTGLNNELVLFEAVNAWEPKELKRLLSFGARQVIHRKINTQGGQFDECPLSVCLGKKDGEATAEVMLEDLFEKNKYSDGEIKRIMNSRHNRDMTVFQYIASLDKDNPIKKLLLEKTRIRFPSRFNPEQDRIEGDLLFSKKTGSFTSDQGQKRIRLGTKYDRIAKIREQYNPGVSNKTFVNRDDAVDAVSKCNRPSTQSNKLKTNTEVLPNRAKQPNQRSAVQRRNMHEKTAGDNSIPVRKREMLSIDKLLTSGSALTGTVQQQASSRKMTEKKVGLASDVRVESAKNPSQSAGRESIVTNSRRANDNGVASRKLPRRSLIRQ